MALGGLRVLLVVSSAMTSRYVLELSDSESSAERRRASRGPSARKSLAQQGPCLPTDQPGCLGAQPSEGRAKPDLRTNGSRRGRLSAGHAAPRPRFARSAGFEQERRRASPSRRRCVIETPVTTAVESGHVACALRRPQSTGERRRSQEARAGTRRQGGRMWSRPREAGEMRAHERAIIVERWRRWHRRRRGRRAGRASPAPLDGVRASAGTGARPRAARRTRRPASWPC